MNDGTWPQRLLALLERQHELVDRLVILADSQGTLISEVRTDALLELLAERQAIIDEFTTTQANLAGLTADLERRLADVDPAQRDRIRSLLNRIGERLAAVMRRDEADQELLRASRDGVRGEIAALGTARHARNAYVNSPALASAGGNRFADRHG